MKHQLFLEGFGFIQTIETSWNFHQILDKNFLERKSFGCYYYCGKNIQTNILNTLMMNASKSVRLFVSLMAS